MALWTPQEIIGLLGGWYKADETGTIEQNDNLGDVSKWLDQSLEGNDLPQVTLDRQPHTGDGGQQINSLNTIFFESATQVEYLGASGMSGFNDNEVDIYVMYQTDTNSAGQQLMRFGNVGSALEIDDVEQITSMRIVTTTTNIDEAGTLRDTNVHLGNWQWDGADFYHRLDSVQDLTNTADGVVTGNFSDFRTGANSFGTGGGLNGKIAEIILCPTFLSVTNRQLIEGYIEHKWGNQGSLPGGHPYKDNAPMIGVDEVRSLVNDGLVNSGLVNGGLIQ